jgi:tetratricopeptide (TPR) repeat protein
MVSSEQYRTLRAALWSVKGDPSAVMSILSSHSDGGESWLTGAFSELRYKLAQGRLADGEEIGRLLAVVLRAQQSFEKTAVVDDSFSQVLDRLISAVGIILAQDNSRGIGKLEKLTQEKDEKSSLIWIAQLWICRAWMDTGDLEAAARAGKKLIAVSQKLDTQAMGTGLCTLGEIEFRRGNLAIALEQLNHACGAFKAEGDRRGVATALIAQAKAYQAANDLKKAERVAREAMVGDSRWEVPPIFLARLNLRRGDIKAAEDILEGLAARQPQAVGLVRENALISAVKNGVVSEAVASEYIELQDAIPSEAVLKRLDRAVGQNARFLPLQELLAWTLLRLGLDSRAAIVFESLAERDLDPDLQASVLLGLGSLASRGAGRQPAAARVSAAAAVGSKGRQTVRFVLGDDLLPLTKAAKKSRTQSPELSAHKPAALTGSLRLFAIPDLLEFLHNSRRTGTLILTSDAGIGAVHLRGGRLTGAATPHDVPLGDMLLTEGVITKEQLSDVLESLKSEKSGKLLGSLLVERGWVGREALSEALSSRVHDAIRSLLGWTDGQFRFDSDPRATDEAAEVELELDMQSVLLEVFRQMDEDAR